MKKRIRQGSVVIVDCEVEDIVESVTIDYPGKWAVKAENIKESVTKAGKRWMVGKHAVNLDTQEEKTLVWEKKR